MARRDDGLAPETLRAAGLRAGLLAPIVWIGLIAVGDIVRADIDPVVDFISELGERGSSTEWLLRAGGFIGTGLLLMVFGVAVPTARPGWSAFIVGGFVILDGIGRAGAGVYPCDAGCNGETASQALHRLFATIGFVSGILAALAAGVLYQRWLDLLLGIATTGFLLLMIWGENPVHAEGLWERLATGALSLWLLGFTLWLRRDGSAVSR